MANFIENYRGYAIYYYAPGEYSGYQDDGYSASGISRLYSNLRDLRNHIDALLEPPEPPPPEPPPPEPPEEPEPPPPEPPPPEPPPTDELFEVYRGIEIWWRPAIGRFTAQVAAGYLASSESLPEVKLQIDEILAFLEPPEEPPDGLFAQVVAAIKVWILDNIQPWLQQWGQVFNNWITNVTENITNVVNNITENITNVVNNLYDSVTNIFKTFNEYVTNVSNYLTENITNVYNTTQEYVTNIIGVTDESVNQKISGVTAWVLGLFTVMDPQGVLKDPLGYIRTAFNTLINPWAHGIIKSFWEGFEEGQAE